jgi:hypothetical protein
MCKADQNLSTTSLFFIPTPLHHLFFDQVRVPLAGHVFIYANTISKAVLLSLGHLAWTKTVLTSPPTSPMEEVCQLQWLVHSQMQEY